jgi:hypothetical protein
VEVVVKLTAVQVHFQEIQVVLVVEVEQVMLQQEQVEQVILPQ